MSSTGTVRIALVDFAGKPIDDHVEVRLTPHSGSAGGERMRTKEFQYKFAPSCSVGGVNCSPLGTQYAVEVWSRHYRTDSFFFKVAPDSQEVATRTLLIDPDRVKGITAPQFSKLPAHTQNVLKNALIDQMQGVTGRELYEKLEPRKKACFLNVAAKASHESSLNVWQYLQCLRRVEQDRVFVLLKPECYTFVRNKGESRFDEAPNILHEPMPGFQLQKSFKTRDRHANLQVSFMKNAQDEWAADIDIDEATGFGHALEVMRNIAGGPTEPYQVRELLLRFPPNPLEWPPVDPGYDIVLS